MEHARLYRSFRYLQHAGDFRIGKSLIKGKVNHLALGGWQTLQALPDKLRILRTGHRTVVVNKDQKYDKGLDENIFTLRTLERSKW